MYCTAQCAILCISPHSTLTLIEFEWETVMKHSRLECLSKFCGDDDGGIHCNYEDDDYNHAGGDQG